MLQHIREHHDVVSFGAERGGEFGGIGFELKQRAIVMPRRHRLAGIRLDAVDHAASLGQKLAKRSRTRADIEHARARRYSPCNPRQRVLPVHGDVSRVT